MAYYSSDDIEILCRRANISYKEAAELLNRYDGSLSGAFAQLEAEDRMKKTSASKPGFWQSLSNILESLFCLRIHICSGKSTVLNLSILSVGVVLLLKPILIVIAAAACILLGYRCNFERNAQDFSWSQIRRNATRIAETVKKTAAGLAERMKSAEDKKE